MRKLFLITPLFIVFMTGASQNRAVDHVVIVKPEATPVSIPISVKVDSINVKAQELDRLIKQL